LWGRRSGKHARRAFEFSQEAIDLAKHTQHHLLLANAYLWQGLTQCNSFFDNPEAARESYDLARASCEANPSDNIWQDLQTLGAKILRKGSVDPALKAWSQGAVGEKTFRQISEEFAEIVIARVWERRVEKCLAWRLGYRFLRRKCGAFWRGWDGESRGNARYQVLGVRCQESLGFSVTRYLILNRTIKSKNRKIYENCEGCNGTDWAHAAGTA